MIQGYGFVRDAATRLAEAASLIMHRFARRPEMQEPDITSQIVGSWVQAMDGYEARGLRWDAHVLTALGPGSQEHDYGADLLEVIEFDVPCFRVCKGFLVQAKKLASGELMSPRDWERMQDQCGHMYHEVSPASFVFFYSPTGVRVIPASSILSSHCVRRPEEFHGRTLQRFLEEHFESIIGDLALSVDTPAELEQLAARTAARTALLMRAKDADHAQEAD